MTWWKWTLAVAVGLVVGLGLGSRLNSDRRFYPLGVRGNGDLIYVDSWTGNGYRIYRDAELTSRVPLTLPKDRRSQHWDHWADEHYPWPEESQDR